MNYSLYSQISQESNQLESEPSEPRYQGSPSDPSSAQADSAKETLAEHLYALDEIVVTATRRKAIAYEVPSATSFLTRAMLDGTPGNSIGQALAGVSGLVYRSYGGGSAIQTVSLRGMSPEHTLVLIDGQRYNSSQTGLVDFGLLSTSELERVEVTRGGYSALYGADAVGGIVNIITKRATEKLSAKALTSLGSFGYYAHEIGISGTGAGIGWIGSVRREGGAGDYQFWFGDGRAMTMLQRGGADFGQLGIDGRIEYAAADNLSSSLSLAFSTANRGTPGAVTDVQSKSSARLEDENGRSHLAVKWKMSPVVEITMNSSFAYSHETYTDPGLTSDNANELQSFYTNRAVTFAPEVAWHLSPVSEGTAGIELSRAWLSSNEVSPTVRWQRSAYASYQHAVPLPSRVPFEILIYPSLRYDRFSDVGEELSPKIGVNLGLLKEPVFRVRSSWGKSYRLPTFNDLYWRTGGNPRLKPERSTSFDAGFISTFPLFGSLTVDLSYFSINTSDRITWTPTDANVWSPKNIARVEARGVEAEGRWTGIDGHVTLAVNSTWNRVKKRSADYPGDPTENKFIHHVPQQTLNLSGSIDYAPMILYVEHRWVSFRFTTDVNDTFLPSYAVTSATARYSVSVGPAKLFFKGEVTNLFNTSYQIIPFYPMPLREFRGTIGAEL